MKQKRLNPLVLLLISTLACVVPGLSAPAPAPFDPNMLSTIVVLTVDAAVSQTAAAQPFITELPAGTIVPGMTGTTIEQVQDGATKYRDYDGGFEVTFPAGWLAVRPNYSDEFNASMANDGADNPALRNQMTTDLAGYDPNFDRLYSYVIRPDVEKNTIFGFSKMVWDSEDTTSIDNTTMGELVRGLESSGAIPGFRADTAQVRENGNAVMMIEIGGRFAMGDGQGGTIPYYTTIIFFKPTSNSLTRITFTFLQDYNAQISTDVKSIIESIRMVGL